MSLTQHPSELEPRLAQEYVDLICNNALDAAYRALEVTSTDDDTNWTMGHCRMAVSTVDSNVCTETRPFRGCCSLTALWTSR